MMERKHELFRIKIENLTKKGKNDGVKIEIKLLVLHSYINIEMKVLNFNF